MVPIDTSPVLLKLPACVETKGYNVRTFLEKENVTGFPCPKCKLQNTIYINIIFYTNSRTETVCSGVNGLHFTFAKDDP